MKCEQCLEKLSSYVDQALSSSEVMEVERHIAMCEACAEELNILQVMLDELGELEDVVMPQDFHETLMNKLNRPNQEKRKVVKWAPQKWAYWGSGLAAAILVGFMGLTQLPHQVEPEMSPMMIQEQPQAASMPEGRAMPQADTSPIENEEWSVASTQLPALEAWVEKQSKQQKYTVQVTTMGEQTHILIGEVTDKVLLVDELKAQGIELTIDAPCEGINVVITIKK
ncbi:MAG: anti-sigma factor family protein [Cellulosilyticaceae bacterium]